MDFKLNNFSFKKSFEAFEMVRKMVPIMENTEGSYSTNFHMTSVLEDDMTPDLSSLLAQGQLFSKGVKTSSNTMAKVADVLSNPGLAVLDLGKVDIKFKIEDGRVVVKPFDIKAGNVSATVSGSNGLDQSLDYKMDMKLACFGY